MNKNNYAVIMAGGVGSRFWPLSKEEKPKQFLDILGVGETLIQQTFRRLSLICPIENIFIVTNRNYFSLCKNQISKINEDQILCEPVMRNTAPCIAYAAFKIHALNNQANLIVAPSDHLITDDAEYVRTVNDIFETTKDNHCLVTLGIKATRPDTGYGYIQYDDINSLENNTNIKKVRTFTEKPNRDLALQFLDSGDFLWNAGIFAFSSKSIIEAFKKHLRDIYDIFSTGDGIYNTNKEQEFVDRVFPTCKNISIDYGIFEKSDMVYVYPSSFGWSDLGTWVSTDNHLKKDDDNNALRGSQINLYESKENIIILDNIKECVVSGLNGYIVVQSDESLLICRKSDEQEIKKFVNDLKKI